MEPSEFVARRIEAEASKLDRYFGRITSCRVIVEAPHQRRKHGAAFHIEIELGLPRESLVIKHTPNSRRALAAGGEAPKWAKHLEAGAAHKDVYISIRDGFRSARRRLEDYVRRLRGDVKVHARVPALRREKMVPG